METGVLENRTPYKTMINTKLCIDLLFNQEKSVELVRVFIFALAILKMILNCMHRPKDLFRGQSAFSFSAIDRHSEINKSIYL